MGVPGARSWEDVAEFPSGWSAQVRAQVSGQVCAQAASWPGRPGPAQTHAGGTLAMGVTFWPLLPSPPSRARVKFSQPLWRLKTSGLPLGVAKGWRHGVWPPCPQSRWGAKALLHPHPTVGITESQWGWGQAHVPRSGCRDRPSQGRGGQTPPRRWERRPGCVWGRAGPHLREGSGDRHPPPSGRRGVRSWPKAGLDCGWWRCRGRVVESPQRNGSNGKNSAFRAGRAPGTWPAQTLLLPAPDRPDPREGASGHAGPALMLACAEHRPPSCPGPRFPGRSPWHRDSPRPRQGYTVARQPGPEWPTWTSPLGRLGPGQAQGRGPG